MQPKSLPQRSQQHEFQGRKVLDSFFTVVRAAQEATIRDYLERSDYLMKEDIEAAWKVLVPNGESSISRGDLTERLSYYVPHNDVSNTSNLIGGGGSMTVDKLTRLMWNEAAGDPALPCNVSKESWGLLDPHSRGSMGLDILLRMLTTVNGCDKLDYDDVQVVRSMLEMTPEGNIVREENWQQLGSWSPQLEELTPAQRRMLTGRGSGFSLRGGAKLSGAKWA